MTTQVTPSPTGKEHLSLGLFTWCYIVPGKKGYPLSLSPLTEPIIDPTDLSLLRKWNITKVHFDMKQLRLVPGVAQSDPRSPWSVLKSTLPRPQVN